MKYIKIHFPLILFATFLGMSLLSPGYLPAAGEWTAFSNIQFTRGNYSLENSTSTYYFSGGIRYRIHRWNLYATIPLIIQNSAVVTGVGGIVIPSMHGSTDQTGGSPHGGGMNGMMDNGTMSSMVVVLGDFYLYGEYVLFPERAAWPFISVNLKLKVPTAGTDNNFGTGEFDYGSGITLRKSLNSYLGFIDLSYWILGDPSGLNYKTPLPLGSVLGVFSQMATMG